MRGLIISNFEFFDQNCRSSSEGSPIVRILKMVPDRDRNLAIIEFQPEIQRFKVFTARWFRDGKTRFSKTETWDRDVSCQDALGEISLVCKTLLKSHKFCWLFTNQLDAKCQVCSEFWQVLDIIGGERDGHLFWSALGAHLKCQDRSKNIPRRFFLETNRATFARALVTQWTT